MAGAEEGHTARLEDWGTPEQPARVQNLLEAPSLTRPVLAAGTRAGPSLDLLLLPGLPDAWWPPLTQGPRERIWALVTPRIRQGTTPPTHIQSISYEQTVSASRDTRGEEFSLCHEGRAAESHLRDAGGHTVHSSC